MGDAPCADDEVQEVRSVSTGLSGWAMPESDGEDESENMEEDEDDDETGDEERGVQPDDGKEEPRPDQGDHEATEFTPQPARKFTFFLRRKTEARVETPPHPPPPEALRYCGVATPTGWLAADDMDSLSLPQTADLFSGRLMGDTITPAMIRF